MKDLMIDIAAGLGGKGLVKEAKEVIDVMRKVAQDNNAWIHLINMVADDLWSIDQQLGKSDYWQNASRLSNIASSIKEKIKDIEKRKVFDVLQNVSKMMDVIAEAFADDDRARDLDQKRLNDIRIGVEDMYRDVQDLYTDMTEEEGVEGMLSRQTRYDVEQNDRYIQQTKKDFQKELEESKRYK